jgi:hypothetical protein
VASAAAAAPCPVHSQPHCCWQQLHDLPGFLKQQQQQQHLLFGLLLLLLLLK